MKKLPIGIQTFSRIIEEDYLYIDKTKEALELIDSDGIFYFLSRPRRFGKSLFIDTLAEIFEGNRRLFEGLYIYDRYEFVKYPVVKISWGGADYQTFDDLRAKANMVLKQNQKRLGVQCEETKPNRCFEELIQKTYEKYNQKVVVLIDEYDKPILNVIERSKQAKENREFIKGLYEILKENERYIRFAFLTGVSKFSKASVFSGLNMLTDISLNKKYGNICGYTENDIETVFLPYLKGVDLKKVKRWYNGYNFLKDYVYNPFDILQFIHNDFLYKNYWWESGNPSFLIKLIKENNYFIPKLEDIVLGEEMLSSFDIDKINLEVTLYQTGYLTIDKSIQKRNRIEYKLKIPNLEVQMSFNNLVIDYLTDQISQKYRFQDSIYNYLENGDLKKLKNTLIRLFASIPYNNYVNNTISSYEGYYASVIYAYFKSLGITLIAEDVTDKGRIDLTLIMERFVYIIEFKVIKNLKDKTNDQKNSALEQIKKKKYHEKYLHSQTPNPKPAICLIGIEFDKDEKNISDFSWETVR